jgi:hypothetical protein
MTSPELKTTIRDHPAFSASTIASSATTVAIKNKWSRQTIYIDINVP